MANTPRLAKHRVRLDPSGKSDDVLLFEDELLRRVVGQKDAVDQLVNVYQTYKAGLSPPNRPIANLLFLGPSGVGKTRLLEVASDTLFGSERACIKVDCSEFQFGHEIAKLTGSPPGYLGFKETSPTFTEESLSKFHTKENPFSFILFDEIEKADDSLWMLMLGILDKGILTLGDNRTVDFSSTVIILTSNLGAREMEKIAGGKYIGFQQSHTSTPASDLSRIALNAAKKKFSPEFMNRIDKCVVFNHLKPEDYMEILKLQLEQIQNRVLASSASPTFLLLCSTDAGQYLIDEGIDANYGARELNRVLEREVVIPLANLISTHKINEFDTVTIEMYKGGLSFVREDGSLKTKRASC